MYGIALARYGKGLATEEDIHDTELDTELLGFDRDILLMEGLALQTEAEMLIL